MDGRPHAPDRWAVLGLLGFACLGVAVWLGRPDPYVELAPQNYEWVTTGETTHHWNRDVLVLEPWDDCPDGRTCAYRHRSEAEIFEHVFCETFPERCVNGRVRRSVGGTE